MRPHNFSSTAVCLRPDRCLDLSTHPFRKFGKKSIRMLGWNGPSQVTSLKKEHEALRRVRHRNLSSLSDGITTHPWIQTFTLPNVFDNGQRGTT